MQTLRPVKIHDILAVTAQSIAEHCGLVGDPLHIDARSDDQRRVGLIRQVRLLPRTLLAWHW